MKMKPGFMIFSLVVVMGLMLLRTGGKVADVFLDNYSMSETGNVMTLEVGVESSIGYIRGYKASDDGNKKHITFYSTYGLNSNMGAKNEFEVELQPSCNEIYFYSKNGIFKLILQKTMKQIIGNRFNISNRGI